MKIIPVVGHSKSGKTTFIEQLIPQLGSYGYKTAVIKHAAHGFDIDHEGKDSDRLKKAGAGAILISSPQKLALIKDVQKERGLEYLAKEFFGAFDIVLAEGFKDFPAQKIEVFRSVINDKLLTKPQALILVVSDKQIPAKVEQFRNDQIKEIATFLKENVLNKPDRKIRARLTADNKKIPMNTFVQEIMAKAINGLASSLKDVENPQNIIIEVNFEDRKKS